MPQTNYICHILHYFANSFHYCKGCEFCLLPLWKEVTTSLLTFLGLLSLSVVWLTLKRKDNTLVLYSSTFSKIFMLRMIHILEMSERTKKW